MHPMPAEGAITGPRQRNIYESLFDPQKRLIGGKNQEAPPKEGGEFSEGGKHHGPCLTTRPCTRPLRPGVRTALRYANRSSSSRKPLRSDGAEGTR